METMMTGLPSTRTHRPGPRTGSRAWLVGLAAIAVLGACSQGAGDATPASDPAPDRLRAIVLPFLSMAPLHIAAAEGYFDEQNLDVEFVRLARNFDAVAALATGDVDIGSGQLTMSVVNTIASGSRIRLVAALSILDADACAYNGAVAKRDLVESGGLETAELMRGRVFEFDLHLPQGYWVSRMLAPMGLTIDDVKMESLPPPAVADALAGDAIDLSIVSEPYLSQLLETGEFAIWRRTDSAAPGFQISNVMFGPSLLDERPEVGERFMTALLKGIRQAGDGRTPRNLEILGEATGMSREQLMMACWPSVPDDGQVQVEPFAQYLEWAVSRQLTERVLGEDELVDRRFAEYANSALRP